MIYPSHVTKIPRSCHFFPTKISNFIVFSFALHLTAQYNRRAATAIYDRLQNTLYVRRLEMMTEYARNCT
jgi:hypothetical protein